MREKREREREEKGSELGPVPVKEDLAICEEGSQDRSFSGADITLEEGRVGAGERALQGDLCPDTPPPRIADLNLEFVGGLGHGLAGEVNSLEDGDKV